MHSFVWLTAIRHKHLIGLHAPSARRAMSGSSLWARPRLRHNSIACREITPPILPSLAPQRFRGSLFRLHFLCANTCMLSSTPIVCKTGLSSPSLFLGNPCFTGVQPVSRWRQILVRALRRDLEVLDRSCRTGKKQRTCRKDGLLV